MEPRPFRPRLTIGGVPVHAMLAPFPIACFTGAMLCDIVYSQSPQVQWANFAQWLLAFGTLLGALAALCGLVDFLGNRAAVRPAGGWWHLAGNAVVLALALINNFIHARDGWTGVVPTGIMLSVLTVAVMIVTGFLGHRMVYLAPHRVQTVRP